jgi:hypothetical protein
MAIVSQEVDFEVREALAIKGIQTRLASDGTDDDIKLAFTATAIRQAKVLDRSQRIKELIRKGLKVEADDEEEFIFDGDDFIPQQLCIVAQIGSTTTVNK